MRHNVTTRNEHTIIITKEELLSYLLSSDRLDSKSLELSFHSNLKDIEIEIDSTKSIAIMWDEFIPATESFK